MKAPGIDVVLFDLGGVLVELAGIGQMMAWCPDLADVDTLWRRWLASHSVRRFETGAATRHAFAADMVAEFGLPVQAEAFLTAFAAWPKGVVPGGLELLAELRDHCTIASASNTNEIHWARVCHEWGLDVQFHHNFPSHLVGALKPDPAYFEHVLDALGVPAARVLFVDDNRINVDAAASLGIVARRATSPVEVRRVLVEAGFDGCFAHHREA
jgi:glucose-1-phosphatase